MEKEIEEIIKKNLPAQVGETLRKTLQQGEQYKAELDVTLGSLEIEKKKVISLSQQVEQYKVNDTRNLTLEARELKVREDERNLKVSTLEFQLASEKEKTQFSKEVALSLVRNTEYRKTIFNNENQQGYMGPNGVWVQPTPISKNLTEDKSAT